MTLSKKTLTHIGPSAIIVCAAIIAVFAVIEKLLDHIDWNTVTALVAVSVALITAYILVWQTRCTLKVQTLNQLLASWQSPPMFPRIRQRAARELLESLGMVEIHHAAVLSAEKNGTPMELELDRAAHAHVDAVLDFFETVALFVKRDVLDFELAYHTFSWSMGCYWRLTEGYIHTAQKDGDEFWKEFSVLMPRFIERDGQEIAIQQARDFLNDEESVSRD